MLESIFAPYSDWGLLILRVALALLFTGAGSIALDPIVGL